MYVDVHIYVDIHIDIYTNVHAVLEFYVDADDDLDF